MTHSNTKHDQIETFTGEFAIGVLTFRNVGQVTIEDVNAGPAVTVELDKFHSLHGTVSHNDGETHPDIYLGGSMDTPRYYSPLKPGIIEEGYCVRYRTTPDSKELLVWIGWREYSSGMRRTRRTAAEDK